MHAIPLLIALFFAAPAAAGEYENKLAIALALADTTASDEQSVLASTTPKDVAPPVVSPPAKPPVKQEPKFREVRVTKTRKVWGKISCNRNGCRYGWINEKYTVTERVPVTSRTGGYPTTPKQTPWTQGGKKITWQHLTTGVHAGKYDASWLKTLSDAEIQQLHADCHEGTVKQNFIVRPH